MGFKFGTRQSLGLGLVGGGGGAILKPQDVFAILAQPANAMQAAINALPFSPDLLIGKDRVAAGDWSWRDSLRGLNLTLASNTTAAETTWPGYSGTNNRIEYAFKQQAGVIVRVAWTGDGTASRQIPHGLGVVPGMVIVKRRDAASTWYATHRSLAQPLYDYLVFNGTGASNAGNAVLFPNGGIDAAKITIGSDSAINASGGTYVAYLFAHDPSADGIVQCGSATIAANGSVSIPLPWMTQWIMFKKTDAAGEWYIADAARGFDPSRMLYANRSNAEVNFGSAMTNTASGVSIAGGQFYGEAGSLIYLAIRAPY